jgi:RNA polymerase sigma-70 factor, ECF subfamily
VPGHSLSLGTVPTLPASGMADAAHAAPRAMAPSDPRLRETVRLHLDLVWRVLRRGGLLRADAEDACQDVFWILAQRYHAVPEAAQRSFLVSTALRVAADRRRTKWHAAVDTGFELDERASPAPLADEQLELSRAAGLLDRALSTLSDDERAIYILAELEQLSRTEVAAALAIPPGTVASRLRRARESFDAALRRLLKGSRP